MDMDTHGLEQFPDHEANTFYQTSTHEMKGHLLAEHPAWTLLSVDQPAQAITTILYKTA
jgi:hypothetical protein